MAEDHVLTQEQAIAMLADGETVHVFRNVAGFLIGANWTRAQVIEAIQKSGQCELAGPQAEKSGHGLVVFPPDAEFHSDVFFVATKSSNS